MLLFELEGFGPFLYALSMMHRLHDIADIKSTPSSFAIIIPQNFICCAVALNIDPQFFNQFSCNQRHYFTTSLTDLVTNLADMDREGSNLLTLSFVRFQPHMVLEFEKHGSNIFQSWILPISCVLIIANSFLISSFRRSTQCVNIRDTHIHTFVPTGCRRNRLFFLCLYWIRSL